MVKTHLFLKRILIHTRYLPWDLPCHFKVIFFNVIFFRRRTFEILCPHFTFWNPRTSPIDTIWLGIHFMDPSVFSENAFHTGSKHEVTVRTESVCSPCTTFLFDVFVLLSTVPLSVVVSDTMGVELWFKSRTVTAALLRDTSTVPFCLRCLPLSRDSLKKILQIVQFFPLTGGTVEHCHTSPGDCTGY
jgi:hypothetical protein